LKHYGLIGCPLSHSFSERYFAEKFHSLSIQADYRNFELYDLDALPDIIQLHHLDGFNVTIPYKEKIIPYLDSLDDTASKTGAVNCVKVHLGKLKGYNTDIIGFEKSLLELIDGAEVKALVFGSGGASKAVQYVLSKCHIPYLLVSRNDLLDAITYADLRKEVLDEYALLINTTPVGMFPDIQEKLPLPYHLINASHYAFDLIYNPGKTAFLKRCEVAGAKIKNGYDMLKIQAEASFEIFNQ